jgi:iron(III) transport system substrate-binding protein
VIDVSGAGILASSAHKTEAQQFVAFLVGRDAQEILAHDESYEYPLGSGVVTAKPLVPFKTLQPDPITVARLGDGSLAISLLRQASLL